MDAPWRCWPRPKRLRDGAVRWKIPGRKLAFTAGARCWSRIGQTGYSTELIGGYTLVIQGLMCPSQTDSTTRSIQLKYQHQIASGNFRRVVHCPVIVKSWQPPP